jgi:molybdopterin-binding protein
LRSVANGRRSCYDAMNPDAEDWRGFKEEIMKLSARNQLKGSVVEVHKGTTTAHVLIDLGHGIKLTSSITNEAVDELGLKVGDSAAAVIKASDVMIGK